MFELTVVKFMPASSHSKLLCIHTLLHLQLSAAEVYVYTVVCCVKMLA